MPDSATFDRSLLRAIQEASPDGILVVDGQGRVASFNRRFLEIWRISGEQMASSSARKGGAERDSGILPEAAEKVADSEGFIRRIRELYANPQLSDHCEIELKDQRTLERHSVGLRDDSGEYLGRVWFFRDITARKSDEAALRHLAMHDSLTGVMNRNQFFERAGEELRRAQRYRKPLAMLMLDLDHFKRINDVHGHGAGDAVLTTTCQLWMSELRSVDLLARIGGEEFALLMPDSPLSAAQVAAERLRALTSAAVVTFQDREIRFTVSGGIAMVDPDDSTIEAALHRADLALYRAKKAGRNRMEIAPDPPAGEDAAPD